MHKIRTAIIATCLLVPAAAQAEICTDFDENFNLIEFDCNDRPKSRKTAPAPQPVPEPQPAAEPATAAETQRQLTQELAEAQKEQQRIAAELEKATAEVERQAAQEAEEQARIAAELERQKNETAEAKEQELRRKEREAALEERELAREKERLELAERKRQEAEIAKLEKQQRNEERQRQRAASQKITDERDAQEIPELSKRNFVRFTGRLGFTDGFGYETKLPFYWDDGNYAGYHEYSFGNDTGFVLGLGVRYYFAKNPKWFTELELSYEPGVKSEFTNLIEGHGSQTVNAYLQNVLLGRRLFRNMYLYGKLGLAYYTYDYGDKSDLAKHTELHDSILAYNAGIGLEYQFTKWFAGYVEAAYRNGLSDSFLLDTDEAGLINLSAGAKIMF